MSEEPRRNKAARQKQPYRHSSGSKSFLQRQHDLVEERGIPVDRLELFRETHARSGEFISPVAANVHVSLNLILSKLNTYTSPITYIKLYLLQSQMLKLQSQPTLEGFQPLSDDDICKIVLGK